MRYHLLGQTGLYVSELCLGTMTYGGSKGIWENIGSLQQEAVNEQVKFAVEAGINFIDTANVYSLGKSETLLGHALKTLGPPREQLIIATKSTGTNGSIILGFFPSRTRAERIAARSASNGTPVKSCNTMRATTNGISSVRGATGFQFASARTFCSDTRLPSQLRNTDSSTRRMDTGNRETGPTPDSSSCGSAYSVPCRPFPRSKLRNVPK